MPCAIEVFAREVLGYQPIQLQGIKGGVDPCDQWLWNTASEKTRYEVLQALLEYQTVRKYLIRARVVTKKIIRESLNETLWRWARTFYAQLPVAVRVISVYADGDNGFHAENVREHGLWLLSREERKEALRFRQHALCVVTQAQDWQGAEYTQPNWGEH